MNQTVFILALGLMLVMAGSLTALVLGQMDNGRKHTRERLSRLQARFGGQPQGPTHDKPQSIRLDKSQPNGWIDRFAVILPRRDVLALRLARAGLDPSLGQYAGACAVASLAAVMVFSAMDLPLLFALPAGFSLGFGGGHLLVTHLIKRRLALFTKQFPDAIDLMVRGLKSGLPVNECIAGIADELPAPTGLEFRRVTDAMRLGHTLEQALWSASDRLGTTDFKFFVISLSVQKETGGNLGETLGNLAAILRHRQAMKLKVKALSSEAKASAMIVGALPFVMLGLILLLNYDYGIVLFTNPMAIAFSTGALIWMGLGIFVMARMIRFEV